MPWSERFHNRPSLAVVALATLIFLLAACGGDDEPAAAPTTTTAVSTSAPSSTTSGATTTSDASSTSTASSTPTATTAPGTTAEQEVIDRYVGYWKARFEANSGTPDPDDPALRDFATGAQLDAVIAETQSNLDDGLAFKRAAKSHDFQKVTVTKVDGDRAVVQECVVSDGVIFKRATGEIVNDKVSTHNVRGELLRVDGVWRVSEARLLQRFEGVAACALGS